MQEMSAPESTSAEESMTLRVCDRVINCTEIHIDLFEVDTSTGVHVTREGELCVEASLSFKNPFLIRRQPKLLLHLRHRLQSPLAQEASLLFGHIGCKVSWRGPRRWSKRTPYVHFFGSGSKVPSWHIALVPLG